MAEVKLIGYWRSDDAPQWPDPVEFVDDTWDRIDRSSVAEYLKRGSLSPVLQAGYSTCRFCGAANGSTELTDGVYLWPEGLSHYVTDHGVRLPYEVVSHILSHLCADISYGDMDKTWWSGVRPEWK
jgi:hypothetical protein